MKIAFAILFGFITSILIHSDALFIHSAFWTTTLFDSQIYQLHIVPVIENWHYVWQATLVFIWIQGPLLLVYCAISAFIMSYIGHIRSFVYSVLGMSLFLFVVLPKLPVFDILLQGTNSDWLIVNKQIFPLIMFLLFFYLFLALIKRLKIRRAVSVLSSAQTY
tara:strand:- start:8586 stop:9074 length:489 start_codon:yes stop_codon:yes gene_type:complete